MSQRLTQFLRASLPDFIIALVMSIALTYTVSYGFESAAGFRGNVAVLAAVSAPILVALFCGSWSKKAVVPSAVATVVLCVGVLGTFAALMPQDIALFSAPESGMSAGLVNDVDGNYVVFAVIACIVPVVVYLLSRRTVGAVILLVGSMFTCGWIQFLYRDFATEQFGIVVSMVVLVSGLMLFMYQTYRQSVYSAKRAKRTSFAGVAAFSCLLSVFCALLGVGIFYGAINALDLSTIDVKPFTRYAAAPIYPYSDNYNKSSTEGDNTSDDTNDEEDETSETQEEGTNQGFAISAEDMLASPIGQAVSAITGYNADDPDQSFDVIGYLIIAWSVVAMVLLIALIFALIVWLQRRRREWRLARIADKPLAYRIAYLYEFMLGRMERMKIHKPEQITPYEFALGFESTLAPFSRNTEGITFLDVTVAYMDSCWGGIDLSEESYEQVEKFYRAFFRNAREYTGWPRWLFFRFWRI